MVLGHVDLGNESHKQLNHKDAQQDLKDETGPIAQFSSQAKA